MQHPSLVERITRSLAYMLRHQPEQFDLELDEYGYAGLDDVVSALNERLGEPVEAEDVVEAIETGDRPRYEIQAGKIRALYGHSIQVKPGETAKPPPLLYVGISRADAERARRYGLRPGRRSYLHLALTAEDALETGRRASRDYAVITVNALEAWEEGINFYDRKSLFLSDPIPTHFIQVGDVQTDGYGEEIESDRGARPRRGEPSGREGRHDRPRYEQPRYDPPRQEQPRHEHARSEAPRQGMTREESPRHEHARNEAPRHGMSREEPARHEPARPEPARFEARADRGQAPGSDPRTRTDSNPPRQGPRDQDRHGRGDRRPDPRGERRGGFREEHRGDPRPPREDRSMTRPAHVDQGPRRDPPERQEPRAPQQPPRAPASEPARARPAPTSAQAGPSNDAFGMGIFEAPKRKEDPPKPKAPAARPREALPPPEREREPARKNPDESSFGAGI